jgi:hypothetical protein
MNDHDIEDLIASANPIVINRSSPLPLSPAETDLCEAIMSTPLLTPTKPVPESSKPTASGHRRRWLVPAAAAAAILVGAVSISVGGGSDPAWAEPAIEVAEAAPRLLVDSDGWSVVSVERFTPAFGQVTFSNESQTLELFWDSIDQLEGLRDDRANSAIETSVATLDGRSVELFDYGRGQFRAVWASDNDAVEVVVDPAGSFDEVVALLEQLEPVDVDTWLEAMPADIVRPDSRVLIVDDILTGVPVPESVDTAALRAGDGVGNRNQITAEVIGPVVCGWVDVWFDGLENGDEAAVASAEQALSGAHEWPILVELYGDAGEDWVDSIWEGTDAVAFGNDVTYGPGPGPITRDYAAGALGCTNQ